MSPGRTATLLRLVAVGGLAVDVIVHLQLAPAYDALGSAVTQGALFRAEAALAAAGAVVLLLRDSRPAWLFGGLVALAGVLALVVTRYVDVPAFGPFPAVHEPLWYPEKAWVTVAMLATVLAAIAREALRRSSGQVQPAQHPVH